MSDHIEHPCAKCGSLLHHADKCPGKPNPSPTQPAEALAIGNIPDAVVNAMRSALMDNPCFIEENGSRRYFSDDDLRRALAAAGWNARGEEVEATRKQYALAQNEILRLSGMLRVSNTERNDAQKAARDLATRLAEVEGERDAAERSAELISSACDKLRIQHREQRMEWDRHSNETAKNIIENHEAFTALRHRLTALEAALAAAPHGHGCDMLVYQGYVEKPKLFCTCWKSTAPLPLAGEGQAGTMEGR